MLAQFTKREVHRHHFKALKPRQNKRHPYFVSKFYATAGYRQHNVLIAVDLKAESVGQDVVRLAEKHKVLHRLLFIGRTITEPELRKQIKGTSAKAHTAAVANNAGEFSTALAAPNANWVYFRYLPPKGQIEAVHQANKRAFIAGPTVAGHVPENWQHCADVGLDAILTDFPLELRTTIRNSMEVKIK